MPSSLEDLAIRDVPVNGINHILNALHTANGLCFEGTLTSFVSEESERNEQNEQWFATPFQYCLRHC